MLIATPSAIVKNSTALATHATPKNFLSSNSQAQGASIHQPIDRSSLGSGDPYAAHALFARRASNKTMLYTTCVAILRPPLRPAGLMTRYYTASMSRGRERERECGGNDVRATMRFGERAGGKSQNAGHTPLPASACFSSAGVVMAWPSSPERP